MSDIAYIDEDTWLSEIVPDTNYGSSAAAKWGRLTKDLEENWVARCDFSAEIPAANTITAAVLWLYTVATYTTGDNCSLFTFPIRRCLRYDWVEAEATWNVYKTGSSWGTVGCLNAATDYTTTDQVLQTGWDDQGAWNSVNILALAQDAHANRSQILNLVFHANAQLLDQTDVSYMTVYTSEAGAYGDPPQDLRPYIEVTHTSPGGVTTTTKVLIF